MSEEIIINDVNVSGCRFLDEWKHCDICNELCDSKCLIVEDIECKTYEDCYYKQLKRLQTENERLKEKLNEWEKELQSNEKIINRLIKENEELKQALEEIRGILCKGRTFYDGYFENENLSRTDKAIKVINEVLR